MDVAEHIKTGKFLNEWKEAFKDINQFFTQYERPGKLISKREKNTSLWTELRKPYPGIRLLAIEFPIIDVALKIHLKIWVNENGMDIYEKLRDAPPPKILNLSSLFKDQRPPQNWAAQLKKEGVAVLGLRYNVENLDFLNNEKQSVDSLREIGKQFCMWLLSNTELVGEKPSVESAQALISTDDGLAVTSDADQSALGESNEPNTNVEGTIEATNSIGEDSRFKDLTEKNRLALVNARLGQGGYRKRMLNLWENRCALTGCDIATIVVASHAIPWCDGTIEDCLDEYNGLLLVASFDRLFDAGMISFSDDGMMLKKSTLSWEQLSQLGLPASRRLRLVHEGNRRFLKSHREAHGF